MKFSTKSLRISILLIVILVNIIGSAVLNLISYYSGQKAVEKSYINQLQNMNNTLDYNLMKYYDSHVKLATFLAKDAKVIEAAKTRQVLQSDLMLKTYFEETGDLENLFISTAAEDTEIISAGNSKAKGLHWKGSGFDENITKALKGKTHISAPYKSPVTQRVVVLVTVPIREANNVIGILGMPFDLETYSVEYLRKAKIGKTGYIFLSNLDGLMIAHPNPENIFKTNINKFDWGKEALASESHTVIYYPWEGKMKLLTFDRNKEYGFMTFSTIFMGDIQEDVNAMAATLIWVGLAVLIIGLGVIYWFVNRRFRPLNDAIDRARDLAEGEADLTKRIQVKVEDEIGEMAGYFNKFIQRIQAIVQQVKENTENISSASAEFSSVSSQMAHYSENVTQQASTVASATEEVTTNISTIASASEEMSVNISTVSSTAEEMSQNMVTVASATEEMSASINQIAQNAKEASKIAEKAVDLAGDSTNTMNLLGTAAEEIGKVTEVIKRIADKTNLLALNATIEAASAGEAGKGFAVVANEIKELANQSAQAAEDIANRIKGVQSNTSNAVKVIDDVAIIIQNINEAVIQITNSVEQQSVAANDISSNILEAKSGVNNIANAVTDLSKAANDMSVNSGEAAKGANEVSASISEVNAGAIENNNSAQQVNRSSEDLEKISHTLLDIVNRFKVTENDNQ
jgi:methyl-accepting chemotaxis protein